MSRKIRYDFRLTRRQIALLKPYLVGEEPDENGEWNAHCVLHEDVTRSMSINIKTGRWKCHASCGGGYVSSLLQRRSEWVGPPDVSGFVGRVGKSKTNPSVAEVPTQAKVSGWHSALLSNPVRLGAFCEGRGLAVETIKQYEIGWCESRGGGFYTIPVRDSQGELCNVRKYDLTPAADRRKIWGIRGMNSPRLYPTQVLDENPKEIVICEGELDALIANQSGVPAITRTASADTWRNEWNEFFRDKTIFLAHDADTKGQAANNVLRLQLRGFAKEIFVVKWPFEITEKRGKDLTDFVIEHGPDALRELIDQTRQQSSPPKVIDVDPSEADLLSTLDSKNVGQPLRITATVQGKIEPGYSIPKQGELLCPMNRGDICNKCSLSSANGRMPFSIPAELDPTPLGIINHSDKKIIERLRDDLGIQRCDRIKLDVQEYQAVEVFFVRPSVDHNFGGSSAHSVRKITSVGKHDTESNTTVKITGALYPDPNSQKNEFVSWAVDEQETSIDKFKLDSKTKRTLKKFQVSKGQKPLAKAIDIARDLSSHVTKIVERDEMHVFMDLIFHSVLSFEFDGEHIEKGWAEGLIIGDTRTGKSLAADRLIRHYRLGEMIHCESASFAGIVGGLQQFGSSGEWQINWGILPMNNRRLVVLDEAGGLSPDEIASMSSIRSSGEAQLMKIKQARTAARTRTIWLANPRNGRLADYTYGIDAIQPLIGNPEDIARFTMAMSAKYDPELSDKINRKREAGKLVFNSDSCHNLLLWAWSRQAEHVKFTDGAVRAIYESSQELGKSYTEDPPLIQAANVRVKLASLSVALAARTFSTDRSCEQVIVRADHVDGIVQFLNRIYSIEGFGYKDRSEETLADEAFANESKEAVRDYLGQHPGLAKFLRGSGRFKRQDIEETMNYGREPSNALISQLYRYRMVRKEGGFVVVTPVLHDLLREKEVAQ